MAGRYANILETVGRTPIVRVAKLAPPGINLFVKLEAFNPMGSVKDRLALGVIEAAEIEISQSTRATASTGRTRRRRRPTARP